MTREEFEVFVIQHLEAIRAVWNEYTEDTSPLCMSVYHGSVSAFCLDESDKYICNKYVRHEDDT